MKLRQLVEKLPKAEVHGTLDCEITKITYDSRGVTPGTLFIAIRGSETDGHRYIASAIEKGCKAVVCEQEGAGGPITRIVVKDSRKAMAILADTFYGEPSSKLKMIGVTGTNGKTTITFLTKAILEKAGISTGLLGTVRYEVAGREIPAQRTTPLSLDIHLLLSKMLESNCQACVMEVSSHALAQDRVKGIKYECGVFTNLTRDHLDYHGSMLDYFECKKKLFIESRKLNKNFRSIINTDDSYGQKLAEEIGSNIITFGLNGNPQIKAVQVDMSHGGLRLQVKTPDETFNLKSQLVGRFNVLNILAAVGIAYSMKIPSKVICEALAGVGVVPGRLERIDLGQPFSVLVDYAHTDDALLNVLKTLKEITPGRVLLLFGCGGCRDIGKRAKMGDVAAQCADYSIITTDNPRKERPEDIIRQIEEGYRKIRQDQFETEINRAVAIEKIIKMAQRGDTVAICGKGHETYQEFNGTVIPFDDRNYAISALESLGYKKGV